MNASERKSCFGGMFPSMVALADGCGASGKVFGYAIRNADGLRLPKRNVGADINAWDQCRRCDGFEDCYRFCLARLAMEIAVEQALK